MQLNTLLQFFSKPDTSLQITENTINRLRVNLFRGVPKHILKHNRLYLNDTMVYEENSYLHHKKYKAILSFHI